MFKAGETVDAPEAVVLFSPAAGREELVTVQLTPGASALASRRTRSSGSGRTAARARNGWMEATKKTRRMIDFSVLRWIGESL